MNLVGVADSGDQLVYQHGAVRPTEVVEHPVEKIQKTHAEVQQNLEFTSYKHIYGGHYPVLMKMQENHLREVGRAPHLESSRIALEIFRGDDVDIDFNDVLGDNESGFGQLDPHVAMERKLGIQVKGDF